ncbi:MAG: ABC transporter substrate-binding protein [Rhizobiaceae bacterium]|nr:MAG: ABC transporter substrate-binding protein [Rhizobiaceae bacterium]
MRIAAILAASMLVSGAARADDRPVRLGLMNDQSSIYADTGGPGSAVAARMAIEDAGGRVLGRPVELVVADHQNKADLGASIARKWYDADGVSAIFDIVNSAVSLAVQDYARAQSKIVVHVGSANADLFGKACARTGAMWMWDTDALPRAITQGIIADGGKSWFFVTADYSFGHALERSTAAVVAAKGGRVVGSVRHPFGASDFASFLLQAQSSGADVIGMANAGGDTINFIKQAAEFGIKGSKQRLVALIFSIYNVHSLGLATAQSIRYVEGFYWDETAETRAWADRFARRHRGSRPSANHAYVYSAVRHYLRAAEAAQSLDGPAVMAKMKEMAVSDFFIKNARLREDGRLLNDMLLVEVKRPAESAGAWDYLKIVARIPAASIVRPLAEGGCSFATQR